MRFRTHVRVCLHLFIAFYPDGFSFEAPSNNGVRPSYQIPLRILQKKELITGNVCGFLDESINSRKIFTKYRVKMVEAVFQVITIRFTQLSVRHITLSPNEILKMARKQNKRQEKEKNGDLFGFLTKLFLLVI